MAQKYDLTDIGNALSRVMDNPMTKIIRSGSIGVLGVVNPVAGIVGGIGNDLLSEYNTFKLGHLLNGLASGFNLERRLNELYNYVNSSPEKAIIVANLFKQISFSTTIVSIAIILPSLNFTSTQQLSIL